MANDVEIENCSEDFALDSEEILTNKAKSVLLDRIAKSDAHFKSQQIGEPDLSYEEKWQIAADILKNPSLFLYRFYKHLAEADLYYFNQFKGDYEIDFYLKKIIKNCDERRKRIRVKNRRYEALRRLVNEGTYFSDSEMEKRNPLLYEQMIGQYLTEEEKNDIQTIDKTDLRFTTVLMEHIERNYIEELKNKQKKQERKEKLSQKLENDDDDDTNEKAYSENDKIKTDSQKKISEEEKQMLREEFLSSMHQSFLLGEDTEFDYSTVDDNEEFADLNEDCDEEDRYFDSEEPDDGGQSEENNCDEMDIM